MGWLCSSQTSPELHTLPPSWCCPQHLSRSQIHSPVTLIKTTSKPTQEGGSCSREEHQSSTTAAAGVCGWKNTSSWWQWAVGMCPYTVHVSYPSLEYNPFSSKPPDHWLSLPCQPLQCFWLWKSEYVSLQHRKISATNDIWSNQPHFLQLCMYLQPE